MFFVILSYGLATILFNVASFEPIIATNVRLPRSASLSSVFILLHLKLLEERKKLLYMLFVFKNHIHKPNQLLLCKPVFFFFF